MENMSGSWVMDVLHGGVNHSIYGNGGADCMSYISHKQRFFETAVIVPMCIYLAIWAFKNMSYPSPVPKPSLNPTVRRTVLTVYCMVFGIELGYKLSSRTMIYFLNPCHFVSAYQIYLLTVDATDNWGWGLSFRLHVYSVAGGTLAMAFPVLNTRLMPWQRLVYWAQHVLVVFSPFYLYSFGGPFQMEPMSDYFTLVFSYSLLLLYHFLPLQIFGLATSINLNNMICPAVSDPFKSHYWRLFAVVHQAAWVAVHSKIYIWLLNQLRPYVLFMLAPQVASHQSNKKINNPPMLKIMASTDKYNHAPSKASCSQKGSPSKHQPFITHLKSISTGEIGDKVMYKQE